MSTNEEDIARVTSLRLTPCWRTLALLVPAIIVTVLIGTTETSEAGEPLVWRSLMPGFLGIELLAFTFSLVYWMDEWAEFNRRPREWVVKRFPDAWPLFPTASPKRVEHHRNFVRIVAFGAGWIGVACLLGAMLKATGIAR